MLNSPLENRMTELEDLLAQVLNAQLETQRELNLLSRESREFKAEMRVFKNEMSEFKNEMRRFKIESNKQWGELANKLGTLAEDIVAPSIPRILRQVTGCAETNMEYAAVRARLWHTADSARYREFDVIAVCGPYLLLNETKSRLSPRDVDDFVELLGEARSFFPHYAEKKITGAIASLYVDESLVHFAEKAGLLVLGLGEELMDVLNSRGFKPREF